LEFVSKEKLILF
jgi:hypothetical protein